VAGRQQPPPLGSCIFFLKDFFIIDLQDHPTYLLTDYALLWLYLLASNYLRYFKLSSSSLDFFRLQCGSTASLNNGLHGGLSSSDHTQQQQAHFLQANFDPLLRPGPSVYCPVTEQQQQQLHQQQLALEQQTNNSHHGQQLGQLGAASSGSNLLAVGTALTAQQLQLSLEQQQHLLMQDFQPCFDQQVVSPLL
jgi:hypothetical protein